MECRKVEYNKKKILEIIQDLKYGYAGEVWDSALVFCNSAKKETFQKMFNFKDKVILEIGSGTGICGIFLSIFEPKKIILTDKKEALELINKNIKLNENFIPKNTKIEFEELYWEDKNKINLFKENYKFDYIICSDVIYDKNQYKNLQYMFNELVVEKYTIIILSFIYREETGLEFYDYFKENNKIWDFKKLSNEYIHEDYICDDILLICAKKI